MSHERLHGSAVSGVEYLDGFVSQPSRQPTAVRRPGQREDGGVIIQDPRQRTSRRIPQTYRFTGIAGSQPFSVRRPGQRQYLVLMAGHPHDLRAIRRAPDEQRPVDTGGSNEFSIGRKRECINIAGMPFKRLQPFSAVHVPYVHNPVLAGGGDLPAIGRKRHGIDRIAQATQGAVQLPGAGFPQSYRAIIPCRRQPRAGGGNSHGVNGVTLPQRTEQ